MAKKKEEFIDLDFAKKIGHQEILTVKEFLSTGSTLLDYAISNRKNGGVPVGRITEIFGDKSTGKSLLAFHIMANTQKQGGIVVFIDTERAADEDFMNRMGVDTKNKNNFFYPPAPKSIEGVFELMESVIKVVRQKYPGKEKKVTIVWDSVAATKAKETLEEEYGEGRLGPEARAMSDCFKRGIDLFDLGFVTLICLNQIRMKIGGYGNPVTTPHGMTLPFYASARIEIKSIGKIREGSQKFGRIIGVNSKAYVNKTRMGPGYRDVEFPIMFDWGVDDEASWIDYLKELKYIVVNGGWNTLTLDGVEHKFQKASGFREKLALPGVREKILNIIHENMVIVYTKKPDIIVPRDAIIGGK